MAVDLTDRAIQPGTGRPNLPRAVAFGVGAALVSSLVWYGVVVVTNYELGVLAVGVGWLVAVAVVAGSGGGRGLALQLVSVAVTVAAMAFSEYLIVRHLMLAALGESAPASVPWLLPPDKMLRLVAAGIEASPMTLLFWAIAVWTAFRVPAPAAAAA